MSDNKYSVAERGDVSDQTSLVKRLINRKVKLKRQYIPGGATLMDQIDQETLPQAIYNWLRHCREFDAVTISFCADPSARNLTTTKEVEFDSRAPAPPWVTHPDKRRYLAQQLAKIIASTGLVQIEAKKDGIYVSVDTDGSFSPESDDWKPYIEFTPGQRARREYASY